MKYVLHFNKNRCIACGACTVACMDAHGIEARSRIEKLPRWCAVTEAGDYAAGHFGDDPFPCWHCEDALCVDACRFGAMHRDADTGFVLCDTAKCIGCRCCISACPVKAPQLGYDTGKILKCDGCSDRLAEGLEPLCVKVCPMRALTVERTE